MDEARCKAMMDRPIVELPLIDVIKMSPVIRRYVKRMITTDLNVEQGAKIITAHVSDVIHNKIPEKLPYPGSFVLDCTVFDEKFGRALCDLGSSVSLMPRSVASQLGMTDLRPTRIILILAYRSVRIPDGILEDVPVKIGGCLILIDFIVLTYEDEPKDPLILGRPFLATAGAMIDVKNGSIGLNVSDHMMNFEMDKVRKTPTIDCQDFFVETSTDITAGYVKELGRIEQVNKQASEFED
ncbi:hypothetical protein V5N11_005980 [Cardamine amara subsp. amara]|uniref:Aspartic peptidase DDI1-type domain-containing protein n=1 Tax=Cardamine amara subsp. amara TaxID=228776 RepID=A0ABD1BT38_CARAN